MKRMVVLLVFVVGCGSANKLVPVTGTVTLDGKELPNAVLNFHPANAQTLGLGGGAVTGPDGKYVLDNAQGGKGVAPGEYVVVISRRLRPNGEPADLSVPPMESDARETLPPRYSDREKTILKATVSKENTTQNFALETKK